jgi:hypothetical protein
VLLVDSALLIISLINFEVLQKVKLDNYLKEPGYVISNLIFYSEYNVCFKSFDGYIFVVNYSSGSISHEWKDQEVKSSQLGNLFKFNENILFNDGNTLVLLEKSVV